MKGSMRCNSRLSSYLKLVISTESKLSNWSMRFVKAIREVTTNQHREVIQTTCWESNISRAPVLMNHMIIVEVLEIDHERVMSVSHVMNKPLGNQADTSVQTSIRGVEERAKVELQHTKLTTLAHRISHWWRSRAWSESLRKTRNHRFWDLHQAAANLRRQDLPPTFIQARLRGRFQREIKDIAREIQEAIHLLGWIVIDDILKETSRKDLT